MSNDTCVICGYKCVERVVNCIACKRVAHKLCCTKINLRPSRFSCKSISRHLGRNGLELATVDSPIKKSLRRRQKCLVCGELCDDTERVACTMSCGFGAHKRCVGVLEYLQSEKYESNNPFRCEVVAHQFYKTDVDEICGSMRLDCQKLKNPRVLTPRHMHSNVRGLSTDRLHVNVEWLLILTMSTINYRNVTLHQ